MIHRNPFVLLTRQQYTRIIDSKAAFGATQASRIKARPAGSDWPFPRAATPGQPVPDPPGKLILEEGRSCTGLLTGLAKLAGGRLQRRFAALQQTGTRRLNTTYIVAGLISSLLFAVTAVMASDSERHQQVDGMDIYLGVMPAQLTQEHPGMHGSKVDKEHSYHVLVALFDSKTRMRITDARVKATVSLLGMGGSTRKLEPMRDEPLSYGNYFILHEPELYRIKVQIRRGDSKHVSVAEFVFRRPRD